MTILIAIIVGVIFGASLYMMMGSELKEIAMGVFLLSHGANLAMLSSIGSPLGKVPPVLISGTTPGDPADPLPQALILTAIVIGFAVQAFLLTLLVVTHRRARTLDIDVLSKGASHA